MRFAQRSVLAAFVLLLSAAILVPAAGAQEATEPVDAKAQAKEERINEYLRKKELQRLERAFDELPPDYKEALFLHRVVGLRHAEIAKEMERSAGAVRNLLYRALARLSLLMEKGS